MSVLLKLLCIWVVVGLAPVPADPPPDPLGWGYLGIRLEENRPLNGDGFRLRLTEVVPNAPAARAGLQLGDEVVRISGHRPASQLDAIRTIANYRPGSVIRMEIRRAGGPQVVFVRLGVRPAVDQTGEWPSPFADR
ncbi:MAG: PDZ domain-containing protein [Gemmataceae bacterium]